MFLFVLPHQDDEFFIYPYIRYLKESKRKVKVIYLTNGGYASHDPQTRLEESLCALNKINVTTKDIIFFGHKSCIYDAEIFIKHEIIVDFLKKFLEKTNKCTPLIDFKINK